VPPSLEGAPRHAPHPNENAHTHCNHTTPLTMTLPPPHSYITVHEKEASQINVSLNTKLNSTTTEIRGVRRKGGPRAPRDVCGSPGPLAGTAPPTPANT